MTEEDIAAFQCIVGRHPSILEFEDLSNAELAIADGGSRSMNVVDPTGGELRVGLEFASMDELKFWLQNYSIRTHRPFRVKNSSVTRRYVVVCEMKTCKWMVGARKSKRNGGK